MKYAFPFLSQKKYLLLLRLAVSIVFFMHALVRLLNGSIEQFAGFMNEKGFVFGTAIVWLLTIYEIAGSILMAMNYCTKCICAGFIIILLTGIIIIHASLGWFVGEHGTGGVEYSFILIMALLVIAATPRKPVSGSF